MKLFNKTITVLTFSLILSVLVFVASIFFILLYKSDSYVDSEGFLHDNFSTLVLPLLVLIASILSIIVLSGVILYKKLMKGRKSKLPKRLVIIALAVGTIIYGVNILVDLSFTGTDKIKLIKNADEIATIEELIHRKEFENKALYIDLWGVFCSPCIAEFKFMPELKKQLANEDIAFIYLAIPNDNIDDVRLWKSGVKKYNLEGFNMLASVAFEEKIWEFTEKVANMRAIPHYILVDKNGHISNPDAPRPSSKGALLKEIRKVL